MSKTNKVKKNYNMYKERMVSWWLSVIAFVGLSAKISNRKLIPKLMKREK